MSKLLEKHVLDSLMAYLSSDSLLHSTKSGFRPNHSRETPLLQVINKWLDAINNSQMIGMVMIDFREAFDLVDHTLLLKKLKYYKISEKGYQLVFFLLAEKEAKSLCKQHIIRS